MDAMTPSRGLAAGMLFVTLAACSGRPEQSPPSLKEDTPMVPNATASRPPVPPIDLAAPASVRTATFALG